MTAIFGRARKSSCGTKIYGKNLGAFNEFIEPIAELANWRHLPAFGGVGNRLLWHCPVPAGMSCLYTGHNSRNGYRCTRSLQVATESKSVLQAAVTFGNGTTGQREIFLSSGKKKNEILFTTKDLVISPNS